MNSSFVNTIPPLGVAIGDITIVFVVPTDIEFTAPCIDEANHVEEAKIDCSPLESVRAGLGQMFASTVQVARD